MLFSKLITAFSMAALAYGQDNTTGTDTTSTDTTIASPTIAPNVTGALSSVLSSANSAISSAVNNRSSILPLPTGNGTVSSAIHGNGTSTASGTAASSTTTKSSADKLFITSGVTGMVIFAVGSLLV